MMGFLEQLSTVILERFKLNLHGLVVVFPNRRAGLYFQRELTRKAGGVIVQPEVLTMVDLIESIAELAPIDDIDQILMLYKVHKEIEGENAKSLDEMMGWGHALLSDFNETDNYMADPEAVYKYLDEAKALSLWNPSGDNLTEAQQAYLNFYGSLIKYYKQLRELLISSGQAYAGLMYRMAAEKVQHSSFQMNGHFHIVFAGFNAMTKAEEVIIDTLVKQGKASVYWDSDRYYINDVAQEAGHFLRRYFKDRPAFGTQWIGDSLTTEPKRINITGVGLTTGQAAEVARILSEIPEDEVNRTAVVINDEKLLFPLLNLLPEKIKDINLTMGLSLKNTPAIELLSDYFALHIHKRRTGAEIKYHLGSVTRILNHPWLKTGYFKTANRNDPFSQLTAWRKEKRVFIGLDEIASLFDQTTWLKLEVLFADWNRVKGGLENLISVVDDLDSEYSLNGKQRLFEHAVIIGLNNVLKRIMAQIEVDTIMNERTLKSMILRLVQRQSLRFSGEPMKGLQIMGMLETRGLDFDRIIITGVNEGLLPKTISTASFIPFDVRHHFELPLPRDKEAMYAYYFYRLLQRAHTIHILYNTEVDILNGGEKSRYIQQLIRELPLANPNCIVQESIAPYLPKPEHDKDLSIAKDEVILQRIRSQIEHSVSASQLMTYMRCQLQYFYRYVAGLEEREELDDVMDRSVLGNAIHDALHEIFKGMPAYDDGTYLKSRIKDIPSLSQMAFEKKLQRESLNHGENYLLKEVSSRVLKHFIELEIDRIAKEPVHILELETNHETLMNIGGVTARFRGIIDRVDQLQDGTIRVIDYKSGRVQPSELKMDSENLIDKEGLHNKAFQLCFYLWLFSKGISSEQEFSAGIHSLKGMSQGLIFLSIDGSSQLKTYQLDAFERELISLMNNILDFDSPFSPTSNIDNCRSCDYKYLCGRAT